MKAFLIFAAVLAAGVFVPAAAQAQIDEYSTSLPVRQEAIKNMNIYDLNKDGKIEDWEREEVDFRILADMDLNHDGVVDAKDRKLAKLQVKRQKEERAAEIKKYDRNGDGKLDQAENAVRLADEARERAKQKPSQATLELSKPIVNY